MSGRSPDDKKEIDTTLDDLSPVDSSPSLKPAAVTLDEEVRPEPSATQLLDPVEDAAPSRAKRAPPRQAPALTLDVPDDAPLAHPPRRRVSMKSDAFESAPTLGPARPEAAPLGRPAAWKATSMWSPGLIALVVLGVAVVLLGLWMVLTS